MTGYTVLYFLFINVIGFFIMKADKQRAIKKQYRISEQTLWFTALMGGAIGTTLAMNVYRHKTKHLSFKIGFPLLAVIDLFLIVYFFI